MELKEKYAINHSMENDKSIFLNSRLFKTYNRISLKKLNKDLSGKNIDLGSGDMGFTKYLESIDIKSFPYDYPEFDIEKDNLMHDNESIDFITMNAVIEHIKNPDNIFNEIKRVLKKNGLIFIRTPNWKMCFKNFYNDPTHVTPYTPETLDQIFKLHNLKPIFIEPGLIEKKWLWWNLPHSLKWKLASLINGGTKSIIAVGEKIE